MLLTVHENTVVSAPFTIYFMINILFSSKLISKNISVNMDFKIFTPHW